MNQHIPNFQDTSIVFAEKSTFELKKAYWLFKILSMERIVQITNQILLFAVQYNLPVKWFVKQTAFNHFCGGESISKCKPVINKLAGNNIKTILDYSIEAENNEIQYDNTSKEIINILLYAAKNRDVGFTSLKMTGIARSELLAKKHAKTILTKNEQEEFERIEYRLDAICMAAHINDVSIYVDAEESWIQNPIDEMVYNMMKKYNREKVVIYNTFQMYIKDKVEIIQQYHKLSIEAGFIYGVKLVRGAYWEKEQETAKQKGYSIPVYLNKKDTDQAFDQAVLYCINNIRSLSLGIATHNEDSCIYLVNLMQENSLENNHPHIYFSQLYGMSDHITYNLAAAGYNVAKYVPYGPVKSVLPYLIRRAEENRAIAGQMGRELKMIKMELKRRKKRN